MRVINLVGQRFDMLTVISRAGQNTSKHTTWNCICECGNSTVATSGNLKYGHTKSCGCLKNKPVRMDLIGDRYGMLTVRSLSHVKGGIVFWKCNCACGNETVVSNGHLRSGHTKSCGCLVSEVSRKIANKHLAGKKKQAENGTLAPRKQKDGYIRVHDRNHPRSNKCGFVFEHIKVMTDHLGRDLEPGENVHHKNADRSDNRLENLELWERGQPPGARKSDRAGYCVSYLSSLKEGYLHCVAIEDLKKARWYLDREIAKRDK